MTCSISGYGSAGPYRDAKAYDLLIQSETGLVSVTGTEDVPAKSGIPAADIGAGMYAFSGILAALYERERTGVGTDVEVSLFDSLVEWMGYPLYYAAYGGTPPRRTGTSHAAIAPYGTYAAGDGTEYVLSIQNEREWAAFCEVVLGDPAIATDPRFDTGSRRVAHRDELDAEIAARLAPLSGEEMGERLDRGRIANARRRELARCSSTRSSRRGTAGATSAPRSARSGRSCRPSGSRGREARMDPCPASASTARPSSPRSGTTRRRVARLRHDGVL